MLGEIKTPAASSADGPFRVSPSLIDSYRFMRDVDSEAWAEKSEREFRARIMREPTEVGEPLVRGLCFHSIAEHREAIHRGAVVGRKCRIALDDAGDYVVDLDVRGLVDGELKEYVERRTFERESTDAALDRIPDQATREVWGGLTIGRGKMRLCADGLHGSRGFELKGTGKLSYPGTFERYHDAIQWRCYCEAFGLDSMTYIVCKLLKNRKTGAYFVDEVAEFTLYPYQSMRADIRREVESVISYVERIGLLDHIRL